MKHERIVICAAVSILVLIPIVTFFVSKADAITLILDHGQYSPRTDTIILVPTFTASAYRHGGFYDYYSGNCDARCLSVRVSQDVRLGEHGSENEVRTLERIGYVSASDYVVDYFLRYQPHYLEQYHTIIVLHNEYVTQRLFNALQKHPNVIYLNPNANYGLISIDHDTMTLLSGHDIDGKSNAFDWRYDNSVQEYDKECRDWHFDKISNGYQLNCNPELIISKDRKLLKELQHLQE